MTSWHPTYEDAAEWEAGYRSNSLVDDAWVVGIVNPVEDAVCDCESEEDAQYIAAAINKAVFLDRLIVLLRTPGVGTDAWVTCKCAVEAYDARGKATVVEWMKANPKYGEEGETQ